MEHFYSEPLKAAWMSRYFGVKFLVQDEEIRGWNERSIGSDGLFDIVEFFGVESCAAGQDAWFSVDDTKKWFIAPESLPIFEMQVGDVMVDGKILARNGLPFFWPES